MPKFLRVLDGQKVGKIQVKDRHAEEIELIEEALRDHAPNSSGTYKPANWADMNDENIDIFKETHDTYTVTNDADLHARLSEHLRRAFVCQTPQRPNASFIFCTFVNRWGLCASSHGRLTSLDLTF